MKRYELKMSKKARGLLLMLAMAGLSVLFLAAANWLPSLMQQGFARQYDSIEEAKRSLGLDTVLVPGYFPEGITWPPSFIFLQKKTYKDVVMEFKETREMEAALLVIQ